MKIVTVLILILLISCSKGRKEDRIEENFQRTKDYDLIKKYVLLREDFGTKYSWDNDYIILRNLILGDSLELRELERQIEKKEFHEREASIISDSLNLSPVKSILNPIGYGRLIRTITKTSFLPIINVFTLVESKSNNYLKREKCLMSYSLLGDSIKEYSILVDGKIKKGTFIRIANDSIQISKKQFQELDSKLPAIEFLKSDFEYEGGRMLDGISLYIEFYEMFNNQILGKHILKNQRGEMLNEFERAAEEMLEN